MVVVVFAWAGNDNSLAVKITVDIHQIYNFVYTLLLLLVWARNRNSAAEYIIITLLMPKRYVTLSGFCCC